LTLVLAGLLFLVGACSTALVGAGLASVTEGTVSKRMMGRIFLNNDDLLAESLRLVVVGAFITNS
jgi:hypothetical protein